jgi:hypothetical protein
VTPLQIADAHCGNYQSDGSCLGVYYNRELSVAFVRPLPKCLLCEPVRRCAYFDEVIAPMKLEHPNRERQNKFRTEFASAIHRYQLAVDSPATTGRLCRKCNMRRTASESKQLCDPCRIENGRESRRRAWHKLKASRTSIFGPVSASRSSTEKRPPNNPLQPLGKLTYAKNRPRVGR